MREDLSAGLVNLAVYETPHTNPALDPLPAILARLKSFKETIFFSGYSFTSVDISGGLIAAHNRGVDITCVADGSQYGIANSQWPVLIAAGITKIMVWGGEFDINHEKVIVGDGLTVNANCAVLWGSYNWTTSAEKVNREVMTVGYGMQASRALAPAYIAQIQDTYGKGHSPAVITTGSTT